MPVTGTPAFNGIVLLEVEKINFINADVEMVGHGAFVNTNNGKTYGHTTCRVWSRRTIELLHELRATMEEDMAGMVFEDATGQSSAIAAKGPGGLGEVLREEEDNIEPL